MGASLMIRPLRIFARKPADRSRSALRNWESLGEPFSTANKAGAHSLAQPEYFYSSLSRILKPCSRLHRGVSREPNQLKQAEAKTVTRFGAGVQGVMFL